MPAEHRQEMVLGPLSQSAAVARRYGKVPYGLVLILVCGFLFFANGYWEVVEARLAQLGLVTDRRAADLEHASSGASGDIDFVSSQSRAAQAAAASGRPNDFLGTAGAGYTHRAGGLAERANLVRFLSSRYSQAIERMQEFVDIAYRVGGEARLDPLLILAVAGIESGFDPAAQSKQGAQGLMQVLTRVNIDRFTPFGGAAAAFDPLANMRVGAHILRDFLVRVGSLEGALKAYVGAAALPDDRGYGAKVLSERDRLAAAAGQPPGAPLPPLPTLRLPAAAGLPLTGADTQAIDEPQVGVAGSRADAGGIESL